MKRLVIFFLTLITFISASADKNKVIAKPADSIKVCRLLKEVQSLPSDANLPLFFARKFLGIPYVAHTLEHKDGECLVVNTRQLDCTTLIETVTALTQCAYHHQYTWEAYLAALKAMRYRHGIINRYPSRIHYFTEWIIENSRRGLVTELQTPNPPFTAIQTVKVGFMSSHPNSYSALRQHPEYVNEIRNMEQQLSGLRFKYIPKEKVCDAKLLSKTVRDGDIIAITTNKKGLEIAHLGLAVWKKGKLHLLNASQIHKKVVEEPMTLYNYLQKHPSHTGIRIIRINK